MRISDCSTDVCSSDLDRRWVRDSNMDAGSFGEAAGDYSLAVAPALRRRNVGAPIRAAMCDTSAMTIVLIAIALYLLAAIALVVGAMRGQHPPGPGWLLQIGRAPCWERVCQHVYITEVAGSIKKNKTNT